MDEKLGGKLLGIPLEEEGDESARGDKKTQAVVKDGEAALVLREPVFEALLQSTVLEGE